MKSVVCISQTPDTAAKINVAADGTHIDPAGVKFILNPYDEFALEEAIRCREKSGGEVIAITVGGDSAKEILRTALSMGADQAVIIKDADRGDSFGVAQQLADAIKPMNPDVIFCGRQSVDYDGFQIGPMLGELLGIPAVSIVVKLDIQGTAVKCECEIEGGRQRVETTLPCVITAQKGLNDPRYPSLPNIMKAKSKPITEIAANPPAARTEVVAMMKPDTKRLHKLFATDGDPNAVKNLVQLLHEEAKVI